MFVKSSILLASLALVRAQTIIKSINGAIDYTCATTMQPELYYIDQYPTTNLNDQPLVSDVLTYTYMEDRKTFSNVFLSGYYINPGTRTTSCGYSAMTEGGPFTLIQQDIDNCREISAAPQPTHNLSGPERRGPRPLQKRDRVLPAPTFTCPADINYVQFARDVDPAQRQTTLCVLGGYNLFCAYTSNGAYTNGGVKCPARLCDAIYDTTPVPRRSLEHEAITRRQVNSAKFRLASAA